MHIGPWLFSAAAAATLLSAAPEVGTRPAAAPRRVAVRFRAMVGSAPFECGRSYANIGTGGSTFTPSDFGMYVSDVRLVTATGAEVPLTLEQDGRWQNGTVALLDFENGSGPCSNGNADVRTEVVGTVPDGAYTGVRFTIGVPFDRNHEDLATQPPPLSLTRMFWAWNSGHKFARLDGKTATGKNWVLHLGSTGCTPTSSATAIPTTCAQPNRATIALTSFDVDQDVLAIDAAALYADSNLETNQPQTAAGCMSSPKDADCGPIFAALGLPFNGPAAAAQRVITVVRAGSTVGARQP